MAKKATVRPAEQIRSCPVGPGGVFASLPIGSHCADAEPGSCKSLPACDTIDNYTPINNGVCLAHFLHSSPNEINILGPAEKHLAVKSKIFFSPCLPSTNWETRTKKKTKL